MNKVMKCYQKRLSMRDSAKIVVHYKNDSKSQQFKFKHVFLSFSIFVLVIGIFFVMLETIRFEITSPTFQKLLYSQGRKCEESINISLNIANFRGLVFYE